MDSQRFSTSQLPAYAGPITVTGDHLVIDLLREKLSTAPNPSPQRDAILAGLSTFAAGIYSKSAS
jgi:hypothetical protein